MQKYLFKNENIWEATSDEIAISSDVTLATNIQYDEKYPNSFLDVYYHSTTENSLRPTVILVHDGGYIGGDKTSGDPNATTKTLTDQPPEDGYINTFLNMGYNVVSINYALAPQYKYPVPLYQLSKAVEYIDKNHQTYHIDNSKYILGGGSAGVNLAGTFVNVQTNPEYAKQVKVKPVLHKNQIRAFVSGCGLLENENFGKTSFAPVDFGFTIMARAYLGTIDISNSTEAKMSNVITYMTKDFPPTYIVDGNHGTFYNQAFTLNQKLIDLNIPHKLTYFPISEKKIGHSFEENGSPYAKTTMANMSDFLKEIIE